MPQSRLLETTQVPRTVGIMTPFHRELDLDFLRTSPVRISQKSGSFSLMINKVAVGRVSLDPTYGDRPGCRVEVSLNGHVPSDLVDEVMARLNPLRVYVQQTFDQHIALENAVEADMLRKIGPADSPRVKMPYHGDLAALNALLYPGVAENVLGEEFRFTGDRHASGEYHLTADFVEGDISFPAFRLIVGKNAAHQDEDITIMGRGKRERARAGFVSAMLDDALGYVQKLVRDPAMLAAAAKLTPETRTRVLSVADRMPDTLLDAALPLGGIPEATPFRAATHLRVKDGFDVTSVSRVRPPEEEKSYHFGDGFRVSVPSNGDAYGMKIAYHGRTLYARSEGGFLPGLPQEVATTLWFAGTFALAKRAPEYLRNEHWAIAAVEENKEKAMTPEQRVRAAFEDPETFSF